MKFKLKKQQIKEEINTFDLYKDYTNIIESDNFITFEQLSATILLKMGLGFNSPIYVEFVEKFKKALTNKWDLLFKNFVITFNINLKFSNDVLIPMITTTEQSSNTTLNFYQDKNEEFNKFLILFNNELTNLLDKNFSVEIFYELAIFKSKETNNLKLLFSKENVERI
ncbi:DUF2714 domain-containing protein [Mycoplasma miroungirhinis]|uniref:DUF2714 domain-containing protein n=1 Tax=Mycoplasma miroungirhinis TaxID=754516 RepID=A0A6M4JGP5_9MOLU|nr:DUF2714 domain-containing protein [Mycoplasma miroungirhinis]QJR44182.1 DUF2714 domain-containing protein [Mycoplasma miroungirhinis]